jgi:hypothetical protein
MREHDWFERLMGFREMAWHETQARLELQGSRLRSRVNNRCYGVGELELPSLAELRQRALAQAPRLAGRLTVRNVTGDVRRMHAEPDNAGALFQVASQFNLLEMLSQDLTPEHGVTRYEGDPTQGPACAIAAGAATVYRNYFVPIDGEKGQTRSRQLDCLADLGRALGNEGQRLWRMRNGYALCTEDGLAAIDALLGEADARRRDAWRDLLRIGVQWDVEVTDALHEPRPSVSQAFCSALPVAYVPIAPERWASFATLVLEAAYEATLWAAVLNAARTGSRIVFLTRVGGGAFGNDQDWIDSAMRRAFAAVRDFGLDVRLVSRGAVPAGLRELAKAYRC